MEMRKKLMAVVLSVAFLLAGKPIAYGWGVWGHNHVNKGAVLALPPEMGMFFYNHADFIIEESTVPDLRKHILGDKAEMPRHYIDLERSHTKRHRPCLKPWMTLFLSMGRTR